MSNLVRGTVNGHMAIWDVATMDWLAWDGHLTTGAVTIGTVNQGTPGAPSAAWPVTLYDSSGSVFGVAGNSLEVSGSVITVAQEYIFAVEFDASNNPIYIGKALAGNTKAVSAWQIRKLTFDGSNNPTDIKYANGALTFNAIWNNRAALTYS